MFLCHPSKNLFLLCLLLTLNSQAAKPPSILVRGIEPPGLEQYPRARSLKDAEVVVLGAGGMGPNEILENLPETTHTLLWGITASLQVENASLEALVGKRISPTSEEFSRAQVLDAQHPLTRRLHGFHLEKHLPPIVSAQPAWRVVVGMECEVGITPVVWCGEESGQRFAATTLTEKICAKEPDFLVTLLRNAIDWLAHGDPQDLPKPKLIPAIGPALEDLSPEPLSATDSMRHLHLPEGLEVELFASEPDVIKPIAIAFDERGRAWVAESVDYPNTLLADGQGHDRIKICEDTDGDGKADKFKVFADKLNIPTGLVIADGGVYVAAAPSILFLKDTDGDDVADVREVVYSGFGKMDTHAVHSNFTYGFDNWIWAVIGYSGASVPIGETTREFRQGIFRFKTDGSDMQFLSQTTNNTWGLGLSETLDTFASTANGQHSVHMAFPNSVYEQVLGWEGNGSAGIEDHEFFHPIARYRQVDHLGRFTAAAGHRVYTARSLSPEYWNRKAMVCEPTGHLVHLNILEEEGAGFVARDGWNLLVSSDEWTAPVAAEVGPEGAVWVLDWYNFIIRHNPTPPGFVTGEGNAYETGMRDKMHGRIYRVVPKDRRALGLVLDLTEATAKDLVAHLSDENLFWRLTAQRLLVEKRDLSVVPELTRLTQNIALDAIGNRPSALHALFTLQGLGVVETDPVVRKAVEEALAHPAPAVRRAALRVLPRDEAASDRILEAKLVEDPEAKVRLEAYVALSERPCSPQIGEFLFDRLGDSEDLDDRWLKDAATAAAARHSEGFLRAFLAEGSAVENAPQEVPTENLLANASFEEVPQGGGLPQGWSPAVYSGSAEFFVSEDARTGSHSIGIRSASGADAGALAWAKVKPDTRYRLSGWIKSEGVANTQNGKGALLNVHNIQPLQTLALVGDHYWTRVELEFDTGENTEVGINVLLGGWGRSQGVALYDDVRLEEIGESSPLTEVVRIVTGHFSRSAPEEGISEMLVEMGRLPSGLSEALLDGLVEGWPQERPPKVSAKEMETLKETFEKISSRGQTLFLQLMAKWDCREAFAPLIADRVEGLREKVSDWELPEFERYAAAESMLALSNTEKNRQVLLELLTPQEPVTFQKGILDLLAESQDDALPAQLLGKWARLTPTVRAKAIDIFLQRNGWTQDLLAALEEGRVSPSDFSIVQSQRLVAQSDVEQADRAAKALGRTGARLNNEEREAMLAKFLGLAERKGDIDRGRIVFAENCARCHLFEGQGAEVGPDLSGIAQNDRQAILLEILDPNRSLEGTYRQWNITTYDGTLLSGRLFAESRDAITLLMPEGEKQVIPRTEIEDLTMSSLSLMPEGFENLPEDDLVSVIDFLKQGG